MSDPSSDSFVSDYVKRQREAYAQQLLGGSGLPPVSATGATPGVAREPEMGTLGKVIDFVSRPLYAVTNIADKALYLPERFSRGEGLQGIVALVA